MEIDSDDTPVRRGFRKTLAFSETDSKTKPAATFVDGGFGHANNPSTEIYHELTRSQDEIGTFVSMGTGRKTPDRFRTGILDIIRGSFDALGDTEIGHSNMQRESTKTPTFSYYRFNQVNGLSDMDFDEWKGKNGSKTLEKMDRVFNEWAIKTAQQDLFRKCARELVRRRRLRCRDDSRWESYAKGSYFSCDRSCRGEFRERKWSGREEFAEHLASEHGMRREMSNENARETAINRFMTQWEYPRS